jgi:hypothetical protein
MTLHAAKGLEFEEVFLVGMEEGLFPHSRCATGFGVDLRFALLWQPLSSARPPKTAALRLSSAAIAPRASVYPRPKGSGSSEEGQGLYPNQFIVFESNETDAKIAGRFLKPGKPLKFVSFQQSAWNIKNKNMEQAFLMDLLMDDSISLVTVNSRSGAGKAQPLDAKILTPTGWTTMGKIKRGDFVVGKDGKPTKVTGIFPQGVKNIYRVTFSDKSSTECCEDHLWQVTDNRKPKGKSATKIVSLKDIKDNLKTAGNKKIYKIPMVENIEFVEKGAIPGRRGTLVEIIG